MRRVRVLVAGKVQGVGFRWICAQEARARGVAGFVRNLPDGRVEAAFEGSSDRVEELLAWMRGGPEWARVDSVEAVEEPPRGDPAFRIER